MKKLILTMSALALAAGSMAQDTYTFSQRTETYAEITDGTTVSPATHWEDFEKAVKLPFAFEYFNVPVDSVYIFDSWINFLPNSSNLLSPIGEDLTARGVNQSPVSYKLTGSGSDRILKIQWKNCGFFATDGNFPGNFANCQVWLYEDSYKIEIHYGAGAVDAGSMVDLNLSPTLIDYNGSRLVRVGKNPAAADVYYNQEPSEELDNYPASGTAYVFVPGFPTSVKAANGVTVNCYPNPVGDKFEVSADAAIKTIRVYNATGGLVMQEQADGQHKTLYSAGWPAGVYLVAIETETGTVVRKVIR